MLRFCLNGQQTRQELDIKCSKLGSVYIMRWVRLVMAECRSYKALHSDPLVDVTATLF